MKGMAAIAVMPFLYSAHPPHVRGGSVSRRGLTQAAGIRAQLAWARTSEEADKLIPSYSSGGGPGEVLLLEKRPPPEFSPSVLDNPPVDE